MHKDHENSYNLLFSKAQHIIDLLQGFVHEPWVDNLDFATLEKVPTHFISHNLNTTDADIIWRVKYHQQWLYLYLLTEFQRSMDHFPAARVPLYSLILFQDLIKTKQISKIDKLPLVFPMILYNGTKHWTYPTQLSDLIIDLPAGLKQYQPSFKSLMLDEGIYAHNELEDLYTLLATIFRLENASNPKQINAEIQQLIKWLKASDHSGIRQSFSLWLTQVLLYDKKAGISLQSMHDLSDIKIMLVERLAQWQQQLFKLE